MNNTLSNENEHLRSEIMNLNLTINSLSNELSLLRGKNNINNKTLIIELREEIEMLKGKLEGNNDKSSFWAHNTSSFIRAEDDNDSLRKQVCNLELLLNDFRKKYEYAINELDIERNNFINYKREHNNEKNLRLENSFKINNSDLY